jgi:hypothetical protein
MTHGKLSGMGSRWQVGLILVFCFVQTACAQMPATAPSTAPAMSSMPEMSGTLDTAAIEGALGLKGVLKDDVYHVDVPRDDLHLTVDGMTVPIEAGIASQFYFWLCPCGKTRVIGELVVCDYETDDVLDALHDGWLIKIDAIAPMLSEEHPSLRIVRFHGEGAPDEVAKRIHNALGQMGAERMK